MDQVYMYTYISSTKCIKILEIHNKVIARGMLGRMSYTETLHTHTHGIFPDSKTVDTFHTCSY